MADNSILVAGMVLNLRYRIEHVLNEGADMVTYLAHDSRKGLRVVVKEFSPLDWGKNMNLFEQGKREFMKMVGKIAMNSGKRGLAALTDWFMENGTAYVVEEFVDGTPLSRYVELKRGQGKLTMDQVMFFMEDVVKALRAVHRSGIFHGNISPDQIIIQENGEAKLIGFPYIGYALRKKVYRESGMDGGIYPVANPGYASLEQYQLLENTVYHDDVYSLGAVFYYCVTGVVPPDSIERKKGKILRKPTELNAVITEQEEEVILRSMELDRKYRYPDVDIFYQALFVEAKQTEEQRTLSEVEKNLADTQEREIFGDVNWMEEGSLEDITRNLGAGIEEEVRNVQRENAQREQMQQSRNRQVQAKEGVRTESSAQGRSANAGKTESSTKKKPDAVSETKREKPDKGKAKKKKSGAYTALLILLVCIVISGAVLLMVQLIGSSLFSSDKEDDKVAEETQEPSPGTEGTLREQYELQLRKVYKIYRDEVTDYAVLELEFENHSDKSVFLSDVYDIEMYENGTKLRETKQFQSEQFTLEEKETMVEPGETQKFYRVFYLLDKEIMRISVFTTTKDDSAIRTEKRMKLDDKYFTMESDDGEEPSEEPAGIGSAKLSFPTIEASTSRDDQTLSDGTVIRYQPENLIDGNPNTCWAEGMKGSGIGSYVKMSSPNEQKVKGLIIYNGNDASTQDFLSCGCATEIAIEFSDGTVLYKRLDGDLSDQPCTLDFGQEITTTSIKITLQQVYVPEGAYDYISISEITPY